MRRAVLNSMWTILLLAVVGAVQPAVSADDGSSKKQAREAQDVQADFTLKSNCAQPTFQRIAALKQLVTQLDNTLPNIPPEEAKYLEGEERAVGSGGAAGNSNARDQQILQARFEALLGRRLYFAWIVRLQLSALQIAVNAINDPDHIPAHEWGRAGQSAYVAAQMFPKPVGNADADRIYRMIGVVIPAATFADAMADFLRNEAVRRDPLLTQKQWSDIRFAALSLSDELGGALSCAYLSYAFKHR